MSAAVAATPTSGTHLSTVFRVTCSEVPSNTVTGYNADNHPASPAVNYYFKFSLAGQDDLISPVFSTNVGGTAEWNGVLLPAAGTWTLEALDASDDSQAATVNVVVA